ncbi:MAG: polysaccharide biosynthesis tyrosine autokinase [Ignavibacteriales bacterium]|nr:polysaccharide biosynthesis tyrosine autokinase [Ignavibacteriales bacterium]
MSHIKSSRRKAEISLTEIFRIFNQRKGIVILFIVLSLIAALLFNIIKNPVYQSSVLLKKEMPANVQDNDVIRTILSGRSQDDLETEMQLVQTRQVLNSVINKLSLNIILTNIVEQDGTVTIINLPVNEYQHRYSLNEYPATFPEIKSLNIGLNTQKNEFTIVDKPNNNFDILNKYEESVFKDGHKYSELPSNEWNVSINWNSSKLGNKINFETLNYTDVLEELTKNIVTEKKIKTNIFELFVKSNHAYSSTEIANLIAEEYKQSRIDLHKDNIKYSFTFIDERLQDISKKLQDAENELSTYKASEKIVQIDEQSRQMVEFLSNLESEKLNTELELGVYKNKLNDIEKQMTNDGYVDQTYLTPEQYTSYDSPFLNLLKELTNVELQKLELLQRRTELHPDVILLDEQIGRIKSELSKYNQNTLTAFKIISNSLRNKLSNIQSLIAKYSYDLEKLPDQESKLASLLRQKEAFEKMYNLLLEKREEMRVAELSKLQDIIILDKAIEPIKAIAPNKLLNLILGGFFGLLLGLVASLFLHYNDKKISDINDIEREFNFPILSVIPPYDKEISNKISTTDKVSDRFVSMMEDKLRYKEAFRTLETKLSAKINKELKTVMVTSCEENAGKSSSAANLAITIAQSGKKVLLIDCDIKKPSLADMFGLPKFSSGLIDYLTEKSETPNIYKPIKLTKNSSLLMNLDILPTGVFSNISGEILASEQMKKLLSNLDFYDFVILDTPPISRLSDALSLGRIVKDTMLVIRSKQTEKESIRWALSELRSADINFLGVLVNDCEVKDSSLKYQYGYNYQNS